MSLLELGGKYREMYTGFKNIEVPCMVILMLSRVRGLGEYGDVVRELLEGGELIGGGNDHLVQLRVIASIDGGHPPAGHQHRLETILGAMP